MLQVAGSDARHDPVERLPVQVDDPAHLAQAAGGLLGDRLPDVALVELGVADERDEARARPGAEMGVDVASRKRAEQRRGGAQADAPGREVDTKRVLCAARVGLQPAELPQAEQLAALEIAEQVLDGVEDRRGVRLHRHPIVPAQMREVQRRHDGHDRGAARLVTPHLHLIRVRAFVVGVVDDPDREPQDPSLETIEPVEVDRPHVGSAVHDRPTAWLKWLAGCV